MAANKVSDLALGNYLKIVSTNGIYNQMNDQSELWKYFLGKKIDYFSGREIRYAIRTSRGAAAVGSTPVGGGAFPTGQKSQIQELTALAKDFAATIEVEATLLSKAKQDFARYGEPLAEEVQARFGECAVRLSAIAAGDGTGVIGTISGTPTVSGGKLVCTLKTGNADRGFVGWFSEVDHVTVNAEAGTAQAPTVSSGTHAYFQVDVIDLENNQVTIASYNSAGTQLTITAANDLEDGDFFYRRSQTTIPDLSSAPTVDYNTLTEDFLGLEAMIFNSGEIVDGVARTGILGASVKDCGANVIDSKYFQQGLSLVKRRIGVNRYAYNEALMSDATYDALVESRETDRRFNSVDDVMRGGTGFGYQHGSDKVVFQADRFIKEQRIYMLPIAKQKKDNPLCFYGSEFDFVEPNPGQRWHLKPNSAGHDKTLVSYLHGDGYMINKHPASILCIKNFTTS